MPFWPFKRRRNSFSRDAPSPAAQPLTEKSSNIHAAAPSVAGPTTTTPNDPEKPSRQNSQRKRPISDDEKAMEIEQVASKKRQGAPDDKENVPLPRPMSSIENITALPYSRTLENSPHLRPVDGDRPHIPYTFRQATASQTSIPRKDAAAQPGKLRSKPSAYGNTPSRRTSSKKRKDEPLREEEIRAMSAPIQIPKRPGDGPLRRESKKHRSLGTKGSYISLPPEGSIYSNSIGLLDSRGWEVGGFDMLNPRPSVRLSGLPQYGSPMSITNPSTPSRRTPTRESDRDKTPVTREQRKRQTIGDKVDEMDASDIRMLMERDAKRKERRRKEQQEKLERKLKSRGNRERADSEKGRQRRQEEETRRAEQARQRAEEEQTRRADQNRQRAEEEVQARARDLQTPPPAPTALHPALRDEPALRDSQILGLGIASPQPEDQPEGETSLPTPAPEPEAEAEAQPKPQRNTGTYLDYQPHSNIPKNPFADPEPVSTPASERAGHSFTPLETPMEDPVVETAREVHMSYTTTPPLSPVNTRGASSVFTDLRQERTRSMPEPPPLGMDDRRASEPREGGRIGAWATFFRRGGTKLGKTAEDSPSETSGFSNVSRESMRTAPLPAHLVDTQPTLRTQRSRSGTPQRTQSKFREDLPELPVSPTESRLSAPDMATMNAAAAAAARRAKRSPHPVSIPATEASTKGIETGMDEDRSATRSDTPITPGVRHGLMSASLASIGSEGSWLAGGPGKRASNQSGDLRRRNSQWTASYEELGGDKDAEYFRKTSPRSSDMARPMSASSAIAGAMNEDGSEVGESRKSQSPVEQPFTVHESVRRQPTLVKRDERLKSREALVGEAADIDTPQDSPAKTTASGEGDHPDSPVAKLEKATSVNYGQGKGHARSVSAGSAKLLDISRSKRPSLDQGRTSPSPNANASAGAPPAPDA